MLYILPSPQFRKGFKKMVLGLGCMFTGKKTGEMTIEGYLRQVSPKKKNKNLAADLYKLAADF